MHKKLPLALDYTRAKTEECKKIFTLHFQPKMGVIHQGVTHQGGYTAGITVFRNKSTKSAGVELP